MVGFIKEKLILRGKDSRDNLSIFVVNIYIPKHLMFLLKKGR